MTDTPEQTAEKIAARGREALISRLRPAFEEAAAAHSDVLKLVPEQIEAMVQRAADRADGLQWRRALAGIATEEMGISLGEALSHPAVIRAHEICGAPSYEDSLAELGPIGARAATPASRPATAAGAAAAPPEPAAADPEPVVAKPEPAAAEPEAEPELAATEPAAAEPEAEPEPAAADPEPVAAVAPEPEPAATEPDPALAGEPDVTDAPEPAAPDGEPDVTDEPEAAAPDVEPTEAEDPLAGWDETEPADATAEAATDEPDEDDAEAASDADVDADVDASSATEAEGDDHGLEPELPPASETDFGSFGSETSPLANEQTASETPDQATAQYSFEEFEEEFYEDGLRLSVIHLGGIANLEPAETDIELLMSSDGLDIIRGGNDVLGRLEWDQVKALEVPMPRGRRRVRRPGPTHLVIRTARGDASFEVPEVTPAELRQHLAPVIDDHLRRA